MATMKMIKETSTDTYIEKRRKHNDHKTVEPFLTMDLKGHLDGSTYMTGKNGK
jgi:hypothetical protein